jgi:hypothetical protein
VQLAQGSEFGRPLEGIGPEGYRREEELEVPGEFEVLSQTRGDREFGTIDIEVFDAETGERIASERDVRPNPRTFSVPNPENPRQRHQGADEAAPDLGLIEVLKLYERLLEKSGRTADAQRAEHWKERILDNAKRQTNAALGAP